MTAPPSLSRATARRLRFKAIVQVDRRTAEIGIAARLRVDGDGIYPDHEDVTIEIGALSLTIPAGAFSAARRGGFRFNGEIDGKRLSAAIRLLGRGRFVLWATIAGAHVEAGQDAVPVSLTIGDDSGSTAVTIERVGNT